MAALKVFEWQAPPCAHATTVIRENALSRVYLRHGDGPESVMYLSEAELTELSREQIRDRLDNWIARVHADMGRERAIGPESAVYG